MNKTDFVVILLGFAICFLLGVCLTITHMNRVVYQACETRQPLVIEMGGVKQVYACLKVQR